MSTTSTVETAQKDRQQEMKEAAGRLLADLRAAGRTLWLAGLGVVAEVVEADKKSRDLFERFVERGRPIEERQRVAAERHKQDLERRLQTAGRKAGDTVRDLGKLVGDTIEYETKRALKRAGMITRDDVKTLTARLEALSRRVDEHAARQV